MRGASSNARQRKWTLRVNGLHDRDTLGCKTSDRSIADIWRQLNRAKSSSSCPAGVNQRSLRSCYGYAPAQMMGPTRARGPSRGPDWISRGRSPRKAPDRAQTEIGHLGRVALHRSSSKRVATEGALRSGRPLRAELARCHRADCWQRVRRSQHLA